MGLRQPSATPAAGSHTDACSENFVEEIDAIDNGVAQYPDAVAK